MEIQELNQILEKRKKINLLSIYLKSKGLKLTKLQKSIIDIQKTLKVSHTQNH